MCQVRRFKSSLSDHQLLLTLCWDRRNIIIISVISTASHEFKRILLHLLSARVLLLLPIVSQGRVIITHAWMLPLIRLY
jgi:hypothetical protein